MKHSNVCFSLHSTDHGTSTPPAWASGDMVNPSWYYENEHGEQWIARLQGNKLEFAGMDLGWEGFIFDLKTAETELASIRTYLKSGQVPMPIPPGIPVQELEKVAASALSFLTNMPMSVAGIILNEGELFWVASVLEAAVPRMRLLSRK